MQLAVLLIVALIVLNVYVRVINWLRAECDGSHGETFDDIDIPAFLRPPRDAGAAAPSSAAPVTPAPWEPGPDVWYYLRRAAGEEPGDQAGERGGMIGGDAHPNQHDGTPAVESPLPGMPVVNGGSNP
jgi:hypothetical protein